jgi:hypothetical protein
MVADMEDSFPRDGKIGNSISMAYLKGSDTRSLNHLSYHFSGELPAKNKKICNDRAQGLAVVENPVPDQAWIKAASSSTGSGTTSSPTTLARQCLWQLGHSKTAVDVVGTAPRQESVSQLGKRLPAQLQFQCGHFTK